MTDQCFAKTPCLSAQYWGRGIHVVAAVRLASLHNAGPAMTIGKQRTKEGISAKLM